MTPEQVTMLRSEAGREALAAAATLVDTDRLAAVERLRRGGRSPELAAAALGQARLRQRAAVKFGAGADRLLFTDDGLQQATRPAVAARRARRLAAAGTDRVVDLCCGIGSDAIAFARAGLRVTAVDADPGTAAVAAANAETLGLADRIEVVVGDAAAVHRELPAGGAVFCDPARRAGGRRVFDPAAYSPPWEFLLSLTGGPACLKLGPGIDHALLPAGVEAEWVSVRGEVVEAALWCGALAGVPRRATVLTGTPAGTPVEAAELTGDGTREAPVGPLRRYLYEPDGAVLRAHLVAELAEAIGGSIGEPGVGYLYTDAEVATPFARGYEIEEVLPYSVKRLRAALRARDVGVVTIKKRGIALDPDALRRSLKPSGTGAATVLVTRIAGAPTALLAHPLPAPPGGA
ncbi:class I SAM-dependent methyltransferase [Actinocatenispora sera]